MDLKKLAIRTLSGIIYCGIIVGCTLSGISAISAMISAFAILAIIEFTKITEGEINKRFLPLSLDIIGALCICCSYYIMPMLLWPFVIVCRLIVELYLKNDNPIKSLSISMMTQIYIGVPLASLVWIADCGVKTSALLAIFFFLWINDTGAFISGTLLGRHRLFERISPKKSWEGFFGGYLFNLIAAALFATYCPGFFGLGDNICFWIILATIVTIFGTWGDLVESLIKRSLHVKDSGNIIPGHGGILDRIDSLLLAAPVVLIYLILWSDIL